MSNDNNSRDEWDAMAEVTRRPVCAPAERFHAHLDLCARCRYTPFNLCAEGSILLLLCAPPKRGENRREETK
jgi:hypothetical protein